LRAAVDRELRRARDTGEMQQMYLRWWRDECPDNDDNNNDNDDDDNNLARDTHVPAMTARGDVVRVGPFGDRGSSRSLSDASRTASRRFCLSAAVVCALSTIFSRFVATFVRGDRL